MPSAGDRAILAIHLPDRSEALQSLADEGWHPIESDEPAAQDSTEI